MSGRFVFFLMFELVSLSFSAVVQNVAAREWKPMPSQRFSQTRQTTPATPRPETIQGHPKKEEVNANVVGIVGGRVPTGTMTIAATEVADLLNKEENLRVIAMIGRGKMQNLWDLLYLPQVDFGFVQTDVLEYLKDHPARDEIADKLRYVAPMFPEEVHIIARPEIRTLRDLVGKRISLNVKGTGSAVSGLVILRRLGIDAVVEYEESGVALERMRRGDLSAMMTVLGKPTPSVAGISPSDGFHLLSIPYVSRLFDLYLPATMNHEDYPNLIPPGRSVDTIAVGNVLAVFDWPRESERYARTGRFVKALFSNFAKLQQEGFHPKWKEVSLGATIDGWKRFGPAQEWLDRTKVATTSARNRKSSTKVTLVPVAVKTLHSELRTPNRKRKPAQASVGDPGPFDVFRRLLDRRGKK